MSSLSTKNVLSIPGPRPVGLSWQALWSMRYAIRDVGVSAIPQLIGVFTGFFSCVLIARGLGPRGMGQYALVLSLAGIATTLSDLGIGQTAIRYASRAAAGGDIPKQMAVLRWALRWRLTLVMLVTGAFFLIAPFVAAQIWHSAALTPYLRLGLLGGIFAAFASVPAVYFQSVKRFSTNATVTSAQKIISFAGILLLAALGLWSLRNLIVVSLAASAVGAFAFLVIVPKAALWSRGALHELKGMSVRAFLRSPTMPRDTNGGLDLSTPTTFVRFHMLSTVLCMLIMRADVWMMGYFLEPSQLGVYSAATMFTLPLVIVIGAVNTALWPRASGVTDPHQLLVLLRKTLGYSALLALAMSVYAVSAPLLAPVLLGSAFEDSRLLGQVLSLRYCIALLASPLGIIGYGFGLVRIYWRINLVQMVMVFFIMWTLLPVYGPLGAAMALIANEITGVVLIGATVAHSYRAVRKNLPGAPAATD